MTGERAPAQRMARSCRWNLTAFVVAGAILGLLTGIGWGWLDYGRPDVGFMYGHVIGLAVIFAALGLALAAVRNWVRRNPMA